MLPMFAGVSVALSRSVSLSSTSIDGARVLVHLGASLPATGASLTGPTPTYDRRRRGRRRTLVVGGGADERNGAGEVGRRREGDVPSPLSTTVPPSAPVQDTWIDAAVDIGRDRDRHRRVLVGGRGATLRDRRVVHGGDGDVDGALRGVGAVRCRVVERVRPVVVERRRVGEGTVGVDRQRAVARVRRLRSGQRVAVGVAVVA